MSFMAKKIRKIEIDLQKEVLEGWEPFYNSLNVSILKEARKLGFVLPRVDVVKQNSIYRLRFGRRDDFLEVDNYGGHTRAIVALQRGENLECNLYENHRDDPAKATKPIIYRSIKTLQGVLDLHGRSLERIKANLDFLPEDVRARFLKEYNLVMDEDVLMTRENYENPPPF
jgi:hypothetical protein